MAGASSSEKEVPLTVPPTPPQPPKEAVLKALLDVTRGELDIEFKISERYDSKARTFFGFAVGLFGITQAFVLRSNFDDLSTSQAHWLEATIIVAAAGFLAALVTAMVATLQAPDRNFDATMLFKMASSSATQLEDVVRQYAALLRARRQANEHRLHRLRVVQIGSTVSLVVTAAEFTLAAIYFT